MMLKNILITASNGDLAEAVTGVLEDSFPEINIFGCESGDLWPAKALIKDIFKVHYRNRKFGLADAPGADPVESWISGIVEKFRFNPAAKILPWFQKSQARGNVFNANGEQCSRKNSR